MNICDAHKKAESNVTLPVSAAKEEGIGERTKQVVNGLRGLSDQTVYNHGEYLSVCGLFF